MRLINRKYSDSVEEWERKRQRMLDRMNAMTNAATIISWITLGIALIGLIASILVALLRLQPI